MDDPLNTLRRACVEAINRYRASADAIRMLEVIHKPAAVFRLLDDIAESLSEAVQESNQEEK